MTRQGPFRDGLSFRSRTCYDRLIYTHTEFEVSISYEDMKRNTKCGKWSGLVVVRVSQGHWKSIAHSIGRIRLPIGLPYNNHVSAA